MVATTRTKTGKLPEKIEANISVAAPPLKANTSKPRDKKVVAGRVDKKAAAPKTKTIHKKKAPATQVKDKVEGKVEKVKGVVEGKPGKKVSFSGVVLLASGRDCANGCN